MTASTLFAGPQARPGAHRCYYCGAPCDETHYADEYVKDTFTNRDIVKYPCAEYVCEGCVRSLGEGEDEMLMIDGSTKLRQNKRGMCPRMYSWILTRDGKTAATKAHTALLRATILEPPEPPFAIILADSGQKQLIFRAPIALDRYVYPLLLEDERIDVNTVELRDLLVLALPICAALGKPALLGDIGFSAYSRAEDYLGDIDALERWLEVRSSPLSRLAAWLSPSKEDAQHEHPGIERAGVPAETRRARRSEPGTAPTRAVDREGRGDQALFDFR